MCSIFRKYLHNNMYTGGQEVIEKHYMLFFPLVSVQSVLFSILQMWFVSKCAKPIKGV